MREGIGQRTIHKLSDFLSNESGRVGAKSALAMGGLVGAAALTQMMFAPEAKAHYVKGCGSWADCATFVEETCCCLYTDDHDPDAKKKSHWYCKKPVVCVVHEGGSCQ